MCRKNYFLSTVFVISLGNCGVTSRSHIRGWSQKNFMNKVYLELKVSSDKCVFAGWVKIESRKLPRQMEQLEQRLECKRAWWVTGTVCGLKTDNTYGWKKNNWRGDSGWDTYWRGSEWPEDGFILYISYFRNFKAQKFFSLQLKIYVEIQYIKEVKYWLALPEGRGVSREADGAGPTCSQHPYSFHEISWGLLL